MEQMSPEAVEALAKSLAPKVALALSTNETLANQMMEFQQRDAEFKRDISADLKALRTERYALPSVAIAVAAISLAISLYLAISTSAFQTKTSEDIETLARDVRAAHARQP